MMVALTVRNFPIHSKISEVKLHIPAKAPLVSDPLKVADPQQVADPHPANTESATRKVPNGLTLR
jgi:hypothetical protein